MAKWALKDAKDHLDAIAEAAKGGPQEIALDGGAEVLVITRKPVPPEPAYDNLYDLIRNSPMWGVDLGEDLRPRDATRDIEI